MTKRFWLLMIVLICLSKGKAQQNYYDTDFTLSHQSFVFTIPIEVEHNQIYLTFRRGTSQTDYAVRPVSIQLKKTNYFLEIRHLFCIFATKL